MNKINSLTPHDFGRHGEVLLIPVAEIPKDAKLIEEGCSLIVGRSEPGHHHVLTVPREMGVTIKIYEKDGKHYLDIPSEAKLEHQKTVEKHDTQIFRPGIYIREIRHAYSYG